MKQLFFGNTPIADLLQVVPLAYAKSLGWSDKQLGSPTRSTLPLLALVKDRPDILEKLIAELGMPGDGDWHLEFPVSPVRNQPSMTDLMVRSGAHTLALEAKWTETTGATVAKCLAKDTGGKTRHAALLGWLNLLQRGSDVPFNPDNFLQCENQLIHRAASACDQSESPRLVYLRFKHLPQKADRFVIELRRLYDLLGRPGDFPFYYAELAIQPSDSYHRLIGNLKKESASAFAIRQAFHGEPLFTFGEMKLNRV